MSIFAYGQTGSGKSFAMMGSKERPGLIRSIGDYLFDFIRRINVEKLAGKVSRGGRGITTAAF